MHNILQVPEFLSSRSDKEFRENIPCSLWPDSVFGAQMSLRMFYVLFCCSHIDCVLRNCFHLPAQCTLHTQQMTLVSPFFCAAVFLFSILPLSVGDVSFPPVSGLFFWDYGNSFLLEARRAGADVGVKGDNDSSSLDFRYPSYVQDIMG